jgi:hypothetical protein
MTKSFPRTLRRAAIDDALLELLRNSPWEQAMREQRTSEPSTPFHGLDPSTQVEMPKAR